MSARDYCPHGKYVGGCGIDWMCGPCEMDDPDPTVNEEIAAIARLIARRQEILVLAAEVGLPLGDPCVEVTLKDNTAQIERHRAWIAEIREWAISDDDDAWLTRRHRAAIAAEDAEAARYGADQVRTYTEIDEIREYGYVPG